VALAPHSLFTAPSLISFSPNSLLSLPHSLTQQIQNGAGLTTQGRVTRVAQGVLMRRQREALAAVNSSLVERGSGAHLLLRIYFEASSQTTFKRRRRGGLQRWRWRTCLPGCVEGAGLPGQSASSMVGPRSSGGPGWRDGGPRNDAGVA
jgi:hypothetical protein